MNLKPNQNNKTIELAVELINQPSVTPNDANCQLIISKRLQQLGFACREMPFGEVSNLWAIRNNTHPILTFAGHTDVVPPGPAELWKSPPFSATIKHNTLYGRGAADMKGSLAAMVTACERFIQAHPKHQGSIAFLITSDEEGPAINGTKQVISQLQQEGILLDWCILGEPTSNQILGDTIKNGRRGSLSGQLTILGKQGHVAYPDKATNPIHLLPSALLTLLQQSWDQGNDDFPATSFQITNVNAGIGATNVIPETAEVMFNFRYSPELTAEQIKEQTTSILNQQLGHQYQITWSHSGQPFHTKPKGAFIQATTKSIQEIMQINPSLSTSGGTSDGRFIAPTGTEVIELGPCNHSIHQVNEHVKTEDLIQLSFIYERIMEKLLTQNNFVE